MHAEFDWGFGRIRRMLRIYEEIISKICLLLQTPKISVEKRRPQALQVPSHVIFEQMSTSSASLLLHSSLPQSFISSIYVFNYLVHHYLTHPCGNEQFLLGHGLKLNL